MFEFVVDSSIFAFLRARNAGFTLESIVLNSIARLFGVGFVQPEIDAETFRTIQGELVKLLKTDSQNIRKGVYPFAVLQPESPFQHLKRVPKILWDGMMAGRRRLKGRTTVFSPEAKELAEELPKYYRRNFHYQTSGYLSDWSASLYEHQVELLFNGSADAMRRMILAPLRAKFGEGNGKGLTFLEIGCGTGRATRFVRLAFPKAKIIAIDLSAPYLKQAKSSLKRLHPVDFLQAAGEDLPFKDAQFDAVYSIFLFHELPQETRKQVVAEAARVLKPGGFFGLVDSIQVGDQKTLDPLLTKFPEEYHEPFYRNYVGHSMNELVRECGFGQVQAEVGFVSKLVHGIKAAGVNS